ncbi:MAG: hypothetical protein ACO1RT_07705 [Planctomycetaceae bacterium]
MSLVTNVPWRHFALIVLLASVVRAGVLVAGLDSFASDPDAYREIARCLAVHGVFGLEGVDEQTGAIKTLPTAFRPPLYPWLLSWLIRANGQLPAIRIASLHWAIGTLTVAATYLAARRLLGHTPSPMPPQRLSTAAALAAGLVAIDPLSLQASGLVMTETLAALLVALAICGWLGLVDLIEHGPPPSHTRLLSVTAMLGLTLGLAYLCRPTFILWPALLAAYLIGRSLYRSQARWALAGIALIFVVGTIVSLWTARNFRHYGRPIWATTHGGYTLLLGNNPAFYQYLQTPGSFGQAWDAETFFRRWERRWDGDPRDPSFWNGRNLNSAPLPDPAQAGEIAEDRLAYEAAMATIQAHPRTFVHACLWRLRRLHSPLPLRAGDRTTIGVVAVAGFYTVLLGATLLGIRKVGRGLLRPHWVAGITLWGSLIVVHTFYWTDMRMRAPAVPLLSILAAAALLPNARPLAGDTASVRSDRSTIPAAGG